MKQVNYHLNSPNQSNHHGRLRSIAWLVITSLLILAILLGIGVYLLSNLKKQSSQSAVGTKIVSHVAGPKLFKNSYFEFYSSDDWSYDAADSTAHKLMYILHENGEVAGSFQVYVNQSPISNDLATSMVLPLSVKGNSFTNIGTISEPCGDTYKPGALKYIEEINISSTSMLCVPDTTQYTVILGQIGGNYDLKMVRSSGQIANYIIIYTSSTFTPSAASFLNLIATFKSL